MSDRMNLMDCAETGDIMDCAETGDIKFFKTVSKELLLNARNPDDLSALHVAVTSNHPDCVEEICRKCPELVYHQDETFKLTPLMVAVRIGFLSMVTCMVNAAVKDGGEKVLLRMLAVEDKSALHIAVYADDFEATKFLIEADPEFEYGLNDDGETPLMMAIRKSYEGNDPTAVRIRDLLMEHRTSQRERRKKEQNWTTLQKAASKGYIDALKELIHSSPEQIAAVNDKKQNFVHLAAKYGQTEIIRFILEEADVSSCVLNAQDIDGNTPLHIAALSGHRTVTECLLYDTRVLKEKINNKGQNIIDVAVQYDRK
ncbi:hypothetical protein ACHQM5_010814 [Ranunculus cassubicifolius]